MSVSLNVFYRLTGITKQGFHKKLARTLHEEGLFLNLEGIVEQIRENHPKISLRDIFRMISPPGIGRDRFEQHFASLGYSVKKVRSFTRTTHSLGVIRFPNLVEGLELTGVNQVWVSDITYYQLREKTYYLTFIMELFSRRILGYKSSKTLQTIDTTIPALKMALALRKTSVKGLIFHSDGGGQYYHKGFRKILKKSDIESSMGKMAYENPHAERLNGIIKNNYIIPYGPTNYSELSSALKRAVYFYNTEKPHSHLAKKSPVEFENTYEYLTNKKKYYTFVKPISKTVNLF